jgi:crossover junction endodeoxyribonuclease RusA
VEPEFPIEFVVEGTPVSLQAKRPESRDEWKARVKTASQAVLPEGHWASTGRMAITLYYFPAAPMEGDVDNIVKLVVDALDKHIYMSDRQIERIVVQKFEPGNVFPFRAPSPTLADALSRPKPLLYVRLSNDPFEELI